MAQTAAEGTRTDRQGLNPALGKELRQSGAVPAVRGIRLSIAAREARRDWRTTVLRRPQQARVCRVARAARRTRHQSGVVLSRRFGDRWARRLSLTVSVTHAKDIFTPVEQIAAKASGVFTASHSASPQPIDAEGM